MRRSLLRRFPFVDQRKPRKALDDVVEKLSHSGVRVRAHWAEGEALRVLTAKARAVAADLVVVGGRRRALRDSMIGSTAERLIAMDRHRVLLVRRMGTRAYKQVVIAADEKSRLPDQVAAARLFADAPVVLHVHRSPFESMLLWHGMKRSDLRNYRANTRREAEQRMLSHLRAAGLAPSQLVLRSGDAADQLQRTDGGTLLVISRGRSAIRHLLLGSVTRTVVAHGASDLLLV
jgi:nucleotide-binding universal stress UspA family protein